MRGHLFENFVIVEAMKQALNQGLRPNAYFWLDSAGHEIDLLIEQGRRLFPVEIKSSQTIKAEFFKNIAFFQKIAPADQVMPAQSYVIYAGDDNQSRLSGQVKSWRELPDFYGGGAAAPLV
jgi:hypothetical protein